MRIGAEDETLDCLREALVVVGIGDHVGLALDLVAGVAMAMLSPLLRNIGMSFGLSPMVAIRSEGMPRAVLRCSTTAPLFASGWVTST